MRERETRLSDLRVDNDLKQKDMIDILKTTRSTYSQWELGINDIPILKANELANFYKVSLDYLLGISNINYQTKRQEIDFDLMRKRMKELRKKLNQTQEAVGRKIGFDQRLYAHYEKGTRIPKTFKLMYIAKYFNVSMDYLVGRSDIKKRKTTTR